MAHLPLAPVAVAVVGSARRNVVHIARLSVDLTRTLRFRARGPGRAVAGALQQVEKDSGRIQAWRVAAGQIRAAPAGAGEEALQPQIGPIFVRSSSIGSNFAIVRSMERI